MSEKTIPLEELQAALAELFEQPHDAAEAALGSFAEAEAKRAARLAGAEARLKARLGADHPRVVALREGAAAAARFDDSLRSLAARQKGRIKIAPHEWVVAGQVLDPDGEPVPGVRVRVYDKDRKYDDLLGDTITDLNGEFAAIYHERDFFEVRENLPELYVMVEDAKGKLLYSSRDNVRLNPGRIEYFEIVLSESPKPKPPPKKPRAARKKAAAKKAPRKKKSSGA